YVEELRLQLEQRDEEVSNLREKERQLEQLSAKRDRLNQQVQQFQATVRRQQLALERALVQLNTEHQRLNRLQRSMRLQKQQLEIIKSTIGWKVLNKYREKRQRSAVLRYFHRLLTEPVKRVFKNKIGIREGANDLTSDSFLDPRLECPSTSARSLLVLDHWLP